MRGRAGQSTVGIPLAPRLSEGGEGASKGSTQQVLAPNGEVTDKRKNGNKQTVPPDGGHGGEST
jgi:hypothetical protein